MIEKKAIIVKNSFELNKGLMSDSHIYIKVFDTEELFQSEWQSILDNALAEQVKSDSYRVTICKDLIVCEVITASYSRETFQVVQVDYFNDNSKEVFIPLLCPSCGSTETSIGENKNECAKCNYIW